jgi:hypothetical protein
MMATGTTDPGPDALTALRQLLCRLEWTIQILAAALDDAWERLRQSGSRLARPAYSRAMREVVAKRIMEMAQRGVQDHDALVADALRFVTTNYEEPSKQTS